MGLAMGYRQWCKECHKEMGLHNHHIMNTSGNEKYPDVMQSSDGIHWEPAKPEPYYPNIFEKIKHKLGGHVWTYPDVKPRRCVMCGEKRL